MNGARVRNVLHWCKRAGRSIKIMSDVCWTWVSDLKGLDELLPLNYRHGQGRKGPTRKPVNNTEKAHYESPFFCFNEDLSLYSYYSCIQKLTN